ncbi:MAG: permease [Alphaproteobacteria bacterium]|nr:MAG: permease [Alphaproteobacteria bacterium]
MTLIQGYLFRQVGLPILAACAALAAIGLLSQSLEQLEVIVERGQSVWVMVRLTLLALPQLLAVILPIGLFVGALIALTRLQREQELTATFASGMSRWAVIAPMAALATIVAAVALLTTAIVQPWAQQAARDQAFEIRTDLAALLVEEGRFVQGPEGLTVYVQQIEQSGLLKNIFVYLDDGEKVTTWDAAEARFERVDGEPFLTLVNGSGQEFSSNGVLNQFSFGRYPFPLAAFTDTDDTVTYKPADLYLTDLFNPTAQRIADSGSRGELLAEAHSRLSSPLYAFVAMAMALAAILGGSFSRTGYGGRIAKAAAFFLLVRIAGYGLVPASAWNGWLNLFQDVLPVVATAVSLRVLFRALRPHRRPSGPIARLKARLA